MPFPFMPIGALLALAVLSGALAIFGAALKALDWTIDTVRGSMLNGMVAGIRDWDDRSQRSRRRSPSSSPAGIDAGPEMLEIPETGSVAVVRVVPGSDKDRG
jgi:hypothetical protein